MHTEHAQASRRAHSPLRVTSMRRFVLLACILPCVLLGGAARAEGISNNSIDQRSEHDIFSPALAAAAFKVGLASVAEGGGHGGQQLERGHQRIKREQRRKNGNGRRAPQLLSAVLGEEGDVLDLAAPANVLLQGGTLTSGSLSTTSVYPTTYVTSEGGVRTTVTDRVTVHIVPTPAASPSSSSAQAISSRTPLNGAAAQSSSASSSSSSSASPASSSSSSSSQDASSERATSSSAPASSAPTSTRSSSSSSSSSSRETDSSAPRPSSEDRTTSSSISLSRPSSTSSSSAEDTSSSVVPTSTRASRENETTSTSGSSSSSSSVSSSSSSTRLSVSLTGPTSSSSSSSTEESSTVPTSSSESSSSVASSASKSSSSSSSSREETSSSIESTTPSSIREETSSTTENSSSSISSDATPSSGSEESTSRTPLVPASSTIESTISVGTSYSLSSLTLPLPTDTTSTESVVSSVGSSVFDSSSPSGVLLGSTTPSPSASATEESTISRQTEVPSISSVPPGSNQTTIISEEGQSSRSISPVSSQPSDTTRDNGGESTSQVEQSPTPTAESSYVSPTSGTNDSTSDITSVPESNTVSTPTREAGSDISSATGVTSQNGTSTDIPSSYYEGSRTITTHTSSPTLSPSDTYNITEPITTTPVAVRNGTTSASDEGTLSTSPTVRMNSTSGITSTETGVETSTSDLYAWVPTSTLLANSAEPTTTESSTVLPSDTLSDGEDGADDESTSTSSSFAPFPSEWPSVIVPTNAQVMSISTVPQGNTYISILFNDQLKWSWLCANGDASAQVFAFMPSLISTAINITTSQVLTDKLVAYQPDNYDGSSGTILSVYLGYVPTSYVDALSAAIKAPNSAFYTKSSGIAAQLAKVVNPTLPITAYAQQGVSNTAVDSSNLANADLSSTSNTSSSEKKKTIIIAVVTSIGVFLLGLLAFFAIKAARKNSKGSSALRTPQMQNNLRGFQLQGDRGDSQGYNHHNTGAQQPPMMSQHGGSRNVYPPPSQTAHRASALSRVYGFATGQPIYATQRSQRESSEDHQQNPFRISGYSDASSSDRSGSDHSHGSSAFTHSSDGSGYQQQHWTGPRRNASQHRHQNNNTSGRSSSIDFNAVDPDQVRSSWWRFSDGFGRAFSPSTTPNAAPYAPSTSAGTGGQQFNHHHQSASQFGDLIATSPISATSGRAHVRNSTRRLNIQRGPRGDYSSSISRPQMQENSLML